MKTLKNWLLRYLLNVVLPEEILSTNKQGMVYISGKAITPDLLAVLQSEVKFFEETNLYKVLLGTPAAYARLTMFEKAQNYQDMLAGKMLLYALDLQVKVINTIKQGKVV